MVRKVICIRVSGLASSASAPAWKHQCHHSFGLHLGIFVRTGRFLFADNPPIQHRNAGSLLPQRGGMPPKLPERSRNKQPETHLLFPNHKFHKKSRLTSESRLPFFFRYDSVPAAIAVAALTLLHQPALILVHPYQQNAGKTTSVRYRLPLPTSRKLRLEKTFIRA